MSTPRNILIMGASYGSLLAIKLLLAGHNAVVLAPTAARLATHGTAIRRPCFVSNGRRLIVPAFGAFTGGLNVLDDAFAPVFGRDGLQVWMLGHDGAYPVAARRLRGD